MITRLLIANRGEIARRVIATCRAMGIETVAVHSDADADAPHVAEADFAVSLPGDAATDTYLRAELLVDAATASGCDAVHPGYGFLSENADFAAAVQAAGLTWVGPPPKAIGTMGSKVLAKAVVAAAGVPVLDRLDPETLTGDDFPVLVKASAGGGGRGMRVVREPAELAGTIRAAAAEAASAFGDSTVFCEPYVEHGRHIEVQVLADAESTVWTLGERECSIQRRHQKVVEETPSPMVNPAMREALCAAAVLATRAIDHVGAGTVEFLVAPDGRFFFLETNTRLQVEHPVTECVSGLDLVREQIRIAEGGCLVGDPPPNSGHAIEVRLYAEDPALDWLPQTGRLHRFTVPGVRAEFAELTAPGLRLDAGFRSGDTVSVHYDPMLAKLISWAPTRAEAARALAGALARAELHGPRTNRDLLVRILRDDTFLAGDADTGYLGGDGSRLAALAVPLADRDTERYAALAAALAGAVAARAAAPVQRGVPAGWRNLPAQALRKEYAAPGGPVVVHYRFDRTGHPIDLSAGDSPSGTPSGTGSDSPSDARSDAPADGRPAEAERPPARIEAITAAATEVVLAVAGVRHRFRVADHGSMVCVDSPLGAVALHPVPRFADPERAAEQGSLRAPMPGSVAAISVTEGEEVVAGQPILVLEAMKMQHTISAPAAGVVRSLHVAVGAQIEEGNVLAVVDSSETETSS